MTADNATDAGKPVTAARPMVRRLQYSDISKALAEGLRDFQRAPAYGLVLAAIFVLGGWGLVYLLVTLEINYYVYPMATGFALIAPFIAAGLYEVSHRLERDEPVTFTAVRRAITSAGGKDLSWMAVVTTFAYIIWLDIAVALYVIFYGLKPVGLARLVDAIATTPSGMVFFALGNIVGAVLGVIVYSITVIAMPLLFDRHVDFVTAMITSVNTVLKNPGPMLLYAVIIAVLLLISILSGFIALFAVLPVLGHATWHVYRRAIGFAEKPAST